MTLISPYTINMFLITKKPNPKILLGNVQVDVNHMGSPFDPALHNEYKDSETNSALVAQWKKYADTCQKHGTPAIAQICHPGRQSFRVSGHRGIFAPTLAPSAVPIKVGNSYLESLIGCLVWSGPKEMTTQDVERVIRQFVDTARLMADAGFSGVELHGAHGYLIGMFSFFLFFFLFLFFFFSKNWLDDPYANGFLG